MPKSTQPPADPPTGDPPQGEPPPEGQSGQPPAGGHDPAPPAASGSSDAGAPASGPDIGELTKERDLAKRDLGKLQKEVEGLRAKVKESEDAEKSELQRLQERLAETERTNTTATERAQRKALELATFTEAVRLGFRRPDKALKELDPAAIEYDEGGEPTNVRALLEAALKDDEGLKAAAPPPGDAGQGNRGQATLTIEQIRKMKPEEINARYEEVERVMAGQVGR